MSSSQTRNDDLQEPAQEEEEEEEEEEVLKLEEEVEQMGQKILEYRSTLPDQLTSTLSSLLASQRPVLPTHLLHEPETRPDPQATLNQGMVTESMPLSVADDPEEAEKIQLLKQKISSNASALPIVLNRMKEYMARIDRLESSNGIIHPAFKRKRTT